MHKTISVYFSGTGFSIDESQFLSSSLHQRTEESESQIKMGFNGCGVDYGLTGVIFGSGLDKQCDQVIARIMQEINAGHQVTLNAYGHSRGGIAALLLAKQLANIDKEKLAINLALLDPVPGNLITTSTVDPFQISLANKTMDLSDCKPLQKVLALYPHLPLPAIACHAPLLVSYPKETEVDEEVVNGCHAQAEQIAHPSSHLVKLRVEEFLVQNGTQLRTDRDYKNTEAMREIYLKRYNHELLYVNQTISRDTHSAQGMVINAKTGAKFLNSRHKKLAGDNSQESVALSIEPKQALFSGLQRMLNKYPLIAQASKWTFISFSVAGLLFATGGLAAISFLTPIVAKLGTLSVLVFAPIIGGALSALWYGATKPLLSWCVSKFFYPFYANRAVEIPKEETVASTNTVLLNLGGQTQTYTPTHETAPYQGKSPLHAGRTVAREQLEVDSTTSLSLY